MVNRKMIINNVEIRNPFPITRPNGTPYVNEPIAMIAFTEVGVAATLASVMVLIVSYLRPFYEMIDWEHDIDAVLELSTDVVEDPLSNTLVNTLMGVAKQLRKVGLDLQKKRTEKSNDITTIRQP